MSGLDCIIQMMGGIGNQLFQYAIGKKLEIDRKAAVRFDLGMYQNQSERALSIRKYKTFVPQITATDRATMRVSFGQKFSKVKSLLKPVAGGLMWNVLEDRIIGFEPRVMEITGRWYLRGYWQVPAYFDSIRPLILEQFQPVEPISKIDQELQKRILDVNAVSVHIRRGDLLTHPIYSKETKVQTADYYEASIRELAERVEHAHFFVFSDDPQWCRENIKGHDRITYVDNHDGSTDYVDLYLMSRCRHFVTANSTFSWWGAWLSAHEKKIVIVPTVWKFEMKGPPPGLVPNNWQIGPMSQRGELSLNR